MEDGKYPVPKFLIDPEQYRLSERYWEDLWSQIDFFDRASFEWTDPWLGTGSPDIKDGNPIFSAYSPVLGRGLRVIQEEPIHTMLDMQAWLDTFGGDITEPDRIHELVISCTLSDVVQTRPLSHVPMGAGIAYFLQVQRGWAASAKRSWHTETRVRSLGAAA